MTENIRVLFVDDEPDLLSVTKRFLEKNAGFTLDTATSALKARSLLEQQQYDAIISDYQMTGMDGIAYLKTIRSSGNTIPFIFFTGRGREEIIIEALNEGADGYLQKAGELEEQCAKLADMVRRAVKNHHTEQALSAHEETLQALFMDTTDMIASYDAEGRLLLFNTACAEFYQMLNHIELHPGLITMDLFPSPVQEVLAYAKTRALSGESFQIEFSLTISGGGEKYYESGYYPIRRDGRIGGFSTVIRDITSRKQDEIRYHAAYDQLATSEQQLRVQCEDLARREREVMENEFKYQTLVEYSSDVIFCVDKNGYYTFVNYVFASTFGQTPDYFYGKSFWDIYPKEHADHRFEITKKVIQSGEVATTEVTVPLPDKTLYYFATANPIKDSEGKVQYVLTHAVDITDRMLLERSLKRANRQLNLLTGITRHDILNQITALNLRLDLLRELQGRDGVSEDVAEIESIVNTIHKQIEFTKQYQDIGSREPVWQDIAEILRALVVPEQITFTIDLKRVQVYADILLNRVFYNLLDNSLRHGRTISTIAVYDSISPEGYTLTWQDNGVGIPRIEKERIFERGYGTNTGLGLFFIQEILSITGVSITENGEEGEGARFQIHFPPEIWRYDTEK